MRHLLIGLFLLFWQLGNAQKPVIKYEVTKDTVKSGDKYTMQIKALLSKEDKLLEFGVRCDGLALKTEKGTTSLIFTAAHIGSAIKVKEKTLEISIRLKTLRVDTIIYYSRTYYTTP